MTTAGNCEELCSSCAFLGIPAGILDRKLFKTQQFFDKFKQTIVSMGASTKHEWGKTESHKRIYKNVLAPNAQHRNFFAGFSCRANSVVDYSNVILQGS